MVTRRPRARALYSDTHTTYADEAHGSTDAVRSRDESVTLPLRGAVATLSPPSRRRGRRRGIRPESRDSTDLRVIVSFSFSISFSLSR